MKMKMKKSGQSTLEYVIILSAIVAAIIVGRTMVSNAVNGTINQSVTAMNQSTNRLLNMTN